MKPPSADGRSVVSVHGPDRDAAPWADRGWWLAVEYGVVPARDRFLRRLPKLRAFGRMKELLEPGGRIVYRNLFREDEVKQAWQFLCEMAPWKQHLSVYVKGEPVPVKEAQDVLWCAGFLGKERPDRPKIAPPGKKRDDRPAAFMVGCDRRISLAPSGWDDEEESRRHALTFAKVDERGVLRFDRAAIEKFFADSPRGKLCPLSPAREPKRLAAAFEDVSVRSLGWPLVLEMEDELRAKLGAKALEAEHGFVLKRGARELDEHEAIELRTLGGAIEVRRASDLRANAIAREVRVAKRVEDVLGDGVRLRGVRIEESYVKGADGKYEVEEKFVLSTRFHLGPADDPTKYRGFRPTTVPRASDEWSAWVKRIAEEMP